jgi:general secretion pathway protein J
MDLLMRRDFWQASNREVKDEYGNIKQALTTDSSYLIEFTRSGQGLRKDKNRSNLQRVAYAMKSHESEDCIDAIKDPNAAESGHCFVRYFWPVLDLARDSEPPIIQVLLDDIEDVTFLFRGQAVDFTNPENSIKNNDWQDQWPSPFITPDLTLDLVQVKFKYSVKKLGEIERIYEVPRYAFINE